MIRGLTLGAAIAVLAPVALADDATKSTYIEVEDETMMVGETGLTVDRLEDVDIIGADGEEIGEVEEVLMTADGRIVAVSADVGGFLGMGEREVVIPLERLVFAADGVTTDLDQAQVEVLEVWED